jgi:hypothetical protein
MRRISGFLQVLYMPLFIALCYVNVGWRYAWSGGRRNLSVVQLALNVRGGRTLKLLIDSLHCVLPCFMMTSYNNRHSEAVEVAI